MDLATIDLATNRNPWGPAERVRLRVQEAIAGMNPEEVGVYPEPGDATLRTAIGSQTGLRMNQVILGHGSTDLLGMAVRATRTQGGSLLLPQLSFEAAGLAARAAGVRLVESLATLTEVDVDRLLQAVQPDTRLVYLADVNNPTGIRVGVSDLARLAQHLRGDILLVVDQAYVEYEDPGDVSDASHLLAMRERLLILRTFSKIHALAGLRVGYGLGNPWVISRLEFERSPGDLPRLTQIAAHAALQDGTFVATSRARNQEARSMFLCESLRHRCNVSGEGGNFMVLESVFPAEEFAKDLFRRGIAVKPLQGYGLLQQVRISLGTPEQMAAFWQAATPLLDGAGCSRPV